MGIDPDEFLLGESQTTLQASNGSAAASAARTIAGTANHIAVSPVNITNCFLICYFVAGFVAGFNSGALSPARHLLL
jgi:hypothetical protein